MVVWIPWDDGKTKVLKLKVDLGRSAGGRCSQVPKYTSSKFKYKFKIKKNNYGVLKVIAWRQENILIWKLINALAMLTPAFYIQEEFEDNKGVLRIRKSKKRQHNIQKKKYKRINNDLQNNTHKTKDRALWGVLILWGVFMIIYSILNELDI